MPALSKLLAALVLICPIGWSEWSDRVDRNAGSSDADPIVAFAGLADGATITEPLRYGSIEVLASDPDAGTRNGAGIRRVRLVVVDSSTGERVAARSEYWPSYDFGPPLPDGEYELTATARGARWAGGGSVTETIRITVSTNATPSTTTTTVPVPSTSPTTPPTAPPTTSPTSTPHTSAPSPTTAPSPTAAPPTTAPPTTTPPTTAAPTTPPPTTTPPTAPPTTAPATTSAPTTSADENQRANARSLELLNELRVSQGLGPVASDPTMAAFASDWSIEMTRTGFRHSSGPYAENIVWHSDASMTPEEAAEQFHRMWVDSPGHYANMTNNRWTLAGVGLYRDASGWWGTHVFR